jgi:hypothetical protein
VSLDVRRVSLFFVLSLLYFPLAVAGAMVDVVNGNVVLSADGTTRQLTSSGHDSNAVISHDGNRVAFVRIDPSKVVTSGDAGEDTAYGEIFVVSVRGGLPRRLIGSEDRCGRNDYLFHFRDLDFLSDNVHLVFHSRWGWNQGSIHKINAITGACSLVTNGFGVKVLKGTIFRDYLLLKPTFDYWVLVSPAGKVVRAIPGDGSYENADREAKRLERTE